LFVVVWVLFYSSFFTNFPTGVYDSVRTFGYWFATGQSSPHSYGTFRYLSWLAGEGPFLSVGPLDLITTLGALDVITAPVFVLGSVGTIIALVKAKNRFAVFVAFWGLGILSAYSLVKYKTPWCSLNMILPLAMTAGYGMERLYRWGRAWAVTVAALAIGASLYTAVDLNFYHYDDNDGNRYPYIYAHTVRDFLSLVSEIDSIAAGNPAGKDIGIVIMSPEHWPLPWYLRSYTHTGYWGKVIDATDPILVVHQNQVAEVDRSLGSRYRQISSHDLRPGVRLYLYLRRDVQQ
jgi:predicted membrane-bound mannosyltransferase